MLSLTSLAGADSIISTVRKLIPEFPMLSIEQQIPAYRGMNSRLAAILISLAILATAFPAAGGGESGGIPPGLRTIQVDGHGEARAKPDMVSLNVAIETHAATAAQCARLNATLAKKVSDALKSKLGDKGKIETGGYSLYPEYNERLGREKPQIIGYRAENSILVEAYDIELAGPLIDAAIATGANRINALDFTLKDDTSARSEAIANASRTAQAQANALAASLGVKLKRVFTATTVSEVRPVPVRMRAMAMAAEVANAPTPVEAGEVTIPANVSLVYEIE